MPPGLIVTKYVTVPAAAVAGQEMVMLPSDELASAETGATGVTATVVDGASDVVVVVGATVVAGAIVVVVGAGPTVSDAVPAVPSELTPYVAFTDTVYVAPSVRPVRVHCARPVLVSTEASVAVHVVVTGDVVTL